MPVAWWRPISDTAFMDNGTLQNEIRRRVQASSGLSPEERILAGIKQSELAIRVVEDASATNTPTPMRQPLHRSYWNGFG